MNTCRYPRRVRRLSPHRHGRVQCTTDDAGKVKTFRAYVFFRLAHRVRAAHR